ncbi:MAG: hypothetical protein POG24_09690, partial [Acidocella sp.]|nr:hypothetical protein [Acidocella sp.]
VLAPPAAGTHVDVGRVVARITNKLVSRQLVQDLAALAARLAADRVAMSAEHARLAAMAAGLLARERLHRQLLAAAYADQLRSAETDVQASVAKQRQSARDDARARFLGAYQVMAPAAVERADLAELTASNDAKGKAATRDALAIDAAAARDGVMIDANGNDVAYSGQRADEIALRITALDTAMARTRERSSEVEAREEPGLLAAAVDVLIATYNEPNAIRAGLLLAVRALALFIG